MRIKKSVIATTGIAGALLMGLGAAAPAYAGHHGGDTVVQDGLVNVSVGDITLLEEVNVAVAAQVVAQVCGVNVGPIVVLGRAVDRGGDTETVCEVQDLPITITQNAGQ